MKIMKGKLSIYRGKNHAMINFDWLIKDKWVMIYFDWLRKKLWVMIHSDWLIKKTLNAMDNMSMSCVLFIWCKVNVYNKDRDRDI